MLVVSCLSVALVIGSMAALYTSLPDVAAQIGATQSQLTWVVDGYTLVLAGLVLPAGAVGDRYGRRLVLILGLVVFAAASVIPLLVATPWWLISARALAGLGAAFVMPSTLSLLTAGFPVHQRGRAVGIWAGVAASGAVVGVLCSGGLLEVWTWKSIFVGLAVASMALMIAALTLPKVAQETHPPLDFIGSLCIAAAIGFIVIAVTEAPLRGWTDEWVLALFAAGIIGSATFVLVELRHDHPLLDLRLFADRGFGGGALSLVLQFLVMFGGFFLLVQYLQLVVGYAPFQSALALTPLIVPIVVISLIAPRLAERYGLRVVTAPGMLLIAVGLYFVSRHGVEATYPDFLWPLLAMGSGLGLVTAPATTAIVAATPVEKHGVAAAVNDASRELGAAIGVAVAGSVLAAGYTNRVQPVLPTVPPAAREPVSDSLAAALQVAQQSGLSAQHLADVARDAFVHGNSQAAQTLSAITTISAVILGIWAPGRPTTTKRRHPSNETTAGSQIDTSTESSTA